MSNPITNDAQTRLLFKQFMGVATTELDSRFDAESYNFVPNIFSKDVMIEEVPSSPPIMCSTLDSSSNWLDSSSNYATNTVEKVPMVVLDQIMEKPFHKYIQTQILNIIKDFL